MATVSSPSTSFWQPKHEVFLSFRGEDTRNNFLSYLHDALRAKGIGTYADFKELSRGEEISSALLRAIEESMISAIVFSENYATSSWCSQELTHIMECRLSRGSIVVPIFYHVNPSDVRNQTGSFGRAFVEHERNRMDMVRRWRHALTEAGNLSGWHLAGNKPEPRVIEEIVHDILKKLNRLSPSDCKGLVGIGHRMEEIKALLCIGGEDIRIIGIWGMGGIGKTTLAQAIYEEVSGQFESCYFLANVREELEKQGAIALRNELLSKLLNEENFCIGTPRIGSKFTKDRLRRKRVLVVLDGISDFDQFEILAISRDHFSDGSRIIVTSRDKQVLTKGSVDGIYEVKELNYHDSIQLFSLHAFRQDHLVNDFRDLLTKVLAYAKGLPIALKVLGSTLYQRNKEYWKSALNKLEEHPKPKIFNLLRISFDGLDDDVERNIFLDIACFFKGSYKEHVMKIFDSCYDGRAHCALSNLVDKCLLTGGNILSMHDLLQEMGRKIVCLQSNDPGERSRLWASKDVCRVLKCNTGTKSIEGISLDLSQIGELKLHPDVFARMHNLRIIKFYYPSYFVEEHKRSLLLEQGLNSLHGELRYFHWEDSPLKSLPSNFCLENLVELVLPNCDIEQLWNGDQNLVNLKTLDLRGCKNLTSIPNLSRAVNVEVLLVRGCKSLVELPSMAHLNSLDSKLDIRNCDNLKKFPELPPHLKSINISGAVIEEVPSSIERLSKLTFLDLSGTRIQSLPTTFVNLNALDAINFSNCLFLTEFPNVPANIKELHLAGTAIEEVPLSIECLTKLNYLDMTGTRIENLPTSILKLEGLQVINFSNCQNMTIFPELPESVTNLYLAGTTIQKVPSSVDRLMGLIQLSLRDCKRLDFLSFGLCRLPRLRALDLNGCSNLTVYQEVLCSFKCLKNLDVRGITVRDVNWLCAQWGTRSPAPIGTGTGNVFREWDRGMGLGKMLALLTLKEKHAIDICDLDILNLVTKLTVIRFTTNF